MKFRILLPGVLIAGLCVWAYWPALHGGWIWDDTMYFTDNPLLRSDHALKSIWSGTGDISYFPITATVRWLQWRLWGDRTLGYHLTNVGLHVISAILFWRLLVKLRGLAGGDRRGPPAEGAGGFDGGGVAWVGGLLFAVHPLCVESVAWISELKNTLSLPPLLLAAIAYVNRDAAGAPPRYGRDYLLSVFWFVIAMLCKSTVVMLPFGLLLYAWWRRGRIRRADLIATIPFFVISLGLGLLTVWFEHHQVADYQGVPVEGLLPRLAGAVLAFWFYLGKAIWPADLIPIYPRWRVDPLSLAQLPPILLLLVSAWWLRSQRAGWARHVVFGLGWFGFNLAPMVGLIGLAYLRLSRVADHFAYLALLGLIGWGALGVDRWRWRGGWRRSVFSICATVVVAGLAAQTRAYAGNFRNEFRFWAYTLERNPDAWLAHHNLGNIFLHEGRLTDAIDHYREAVRLNPGLGQSQVNWGVALLMMGRASEAIPHLEDATRLAPDSPEAENSLGMALVQMGRADQAVAHQQRAVQLAPNLAEMRNNLGRALVTVGRLDEAIAQYREAIRLRPDSLVIHRNLALALQKAGRVDEAMDQIEQVQQIERAGADR